MVFNSFDIVDWAACHVVAVVAAAAYSDSSYFDQAASLYFACIVVVAVELVPYLVEAFLAVLAVDMVVLAFAEVVAAFAVDFFARLVVAKQSFVAEVLVVVAVVERTAFEPVVALVLDSLASAALVFASFEPVECSLA